MTMLGKELDIKEIQNFGIQRRVVAHMTHESWKNIPHVSVQYEPDVTHFMEYFKNYRKEHAEKSPDASRVSINTVILKAISEGLKAAPHLNSIFEYSSITKFGKLMVCEKINVAIPLLLDDGRDITPIIPDVGNKTIIEIANYIKDLQERVSKTNIDQMLYDVSRAERIHDLKRLKLGVIPSILKGQFGKHKIKTLNGDKLKKYRKIPDDQKLSTKDIVNGSVLVSNMGSVYRGHKGHISLLEIIPPQTFVVGVAAVQKRPSVYMNNKGEECVGIRSVLPMCLAFDHRPFDYSHLVPFMERLDSIFENPEAFFEENSF